MSASNRLIRQGWKSTTLKAGDQVTVRVHPLKSGEAGGLLVSVSKADGVALDRAEALLNCGKAKPGLPAHLSLRRRLFLGSRRGRSSPLSAVPGQRNGFSLRAGQAFGGN